MYASETLDRISNGNAKSCIQALLKNREHHPLSLSRSPLHSSLTDNTSFGIDNHLPEIASDASEINEYRASGNTSPDNLESQKDFNYSQKLFHIADGNLYSIFSPIQGRSYGMKPSFLRKQKYTVQECHSNGRKNLRKGLKFHNFLPSESVTSEKDNDFLKTKWKVHSECRLREEHGTKQITISNWSQSVQESPADNSVKSEPNPMSSIEATKPFKFAENESRPKSNGGIDPYEFNLSLDSSPESSVIEDLKNRNITVSDSAKKEALNFVLNALMEKPTSSENTTSLLENNEIEKPFHPSSKHRRKPLQTRRIVPYVKYLSIIEENNCLPLDLSSKCSSEPSSESSADISTENDRIRNQKTFRGTFKSNEMDLRPASLPNHEAIAHAPSASSSVSQPFTFLYPVPVNKPLNTNAGNFSSPFEFGTSAMSNPNPFTTHQPALHYSAKLQSKSRRRNQRSVIKQKLEDTFRQNGFLVKTKQVSDGEATFCKFRQLRKYTRYYLKSWQQHLPDEVHKMWKGFLPPKTVLPPVAGNGETVNGTAP